MDHPQGTPLLRRCRDHVSLFWEDRALSRLIGKGRLFLKGLSIIPYGLSTKLIVLFSLLFVLVIVTVSLVTLGQQRRLLTQEVEKRGRLWAVNLAVGARDAVLDHDPLTLNALVGAAEQDQDVIETLIVDHNQRILMHTDVTRVSTAFDPTAFDPLDDPRGSAQGTEADSVIKIIEPIRYGDKTIGTVYLTMSSAGVEELIHQAKFRLITTMTVGLFFGIAGVFVLSRLFLRPVGALARATRELAGGNMEILVPVRNRDELGELGSSFNIMTERLKTAYEQIERGYLDTTFALAAAVEAKDPYTRGHCGRVSGYAVALGRSLGLPRQELRELELAAILHDIGKIGIKDDILTKPTRLSLGEMRIMHLHPEIGRKIMESVEPLHKIAKYTLHHHEHLNGKGYPHGLKGDKIPLVSRIITVVDAFDSMSTHRPYRKALPEDEVLNRLTAAKGKQFDPELVKIFLDVYASGLIAQIKSLHPS